MKNLLFVINFYILITSFTLICSQKITSKCSANFCKVFTTENDCPKMSDACEELNGEIFKAELPCGCCDVCMEFIGENGYCSIGSPDTPPPMMMCGPGLTCKKDGAEYRCKKMDTECFKELERYNKTIFENNPLKYADKPDCDGDGNYGPIKCNIDQTCFCVDEDGNRIFGESLYTQSIQLTMSCECSRKYQKFETIKFKYPSLFTRCLGDGSYDPLQCLEDQCTCIERDSGSIVDSNIYNITKIGFKNVPCYSRNMHVDWKYLHNCEEITTNYLEDLYKTLNESIHPMDIKIKECQPDGFFKQINENLKNKFCVDKYNNLIENYSVPKESEEAKTMHCNCARTQNLLKRNKKPAPECCSNGNFKKVQCRETDNKVRECYCVDENGLQIEKEVLEEKRQDLSCNNDAIQCI